VYGDTDPGKSQRAGPTVARKRAARGPRTVPVTSSSPSPSGDVHLAFHWQDLSGQTLDLIANRHVPESKRVLKRLGNLPTTIPIFETIDI
jgi:hypothetical protein